MRVIGTAQWRYGRRFRPASYWKRRLDAGLKQRRSSASKVELQSFRHPLTFNLVVLITRRARKSVLGRVHD
jgi:hypothetical protein